MTKLCISAGSTSWAKDRNASFIWLFGWSTEEERIWLIEESSILRERSDLEGIKGSSTSDMEDVVWENWEWWWKGTWDEGKSMLRREYSSDWRNICVSNRELNLLKFELWIQFPLLTKYYVIPKRVENPLSLLS